MHQMCRRYEECNRTSPKCTNCGGTHSAGYAGCPRYRQESMVNSTMLKEKVNYWAATEMVRATTSRTSNVMSHDDFPALPNRQESFQYNIRTNYHGTEPPGNRMINRMPQNNRSVLVEPKPNSDNYHDYENIFLLSFLLLIAQVYY